MASKVQPQLSLLADHALWSRKPDWTAEWYQGFYAPLCRERLFLPPLLAYELCAALERGERRLGRSAASRPEFEAWAAFLDEVNKIAFAAPQSDGRGGISWRAAVGRSLARMFALRLMSLNWNSDWTSLLQQYSLCPETLVGLEARRLNQPGRTAGALEECWTLLNELAARNELRAFVPLSTWLIPTRPSGMDTDPFVANLLEGEKHEASMPEPQIRGSNPLADNPRKVLSSTGEFAKRDLGPLPGNLARLAPTELMFLQLGDGEKSFLNIAASALRLRFVMKASQGQLLQRFSQHARHASMEPSGRLHVEIAARPEDHQLSDPPHAPLISWYRAVAVQVAHQFAKLSLPFRWSVSYAITHSLGDKRATGIVELARAAELAVSPVSSLGVLAQACPDAFQAGWNVMDAAPDPPGSPVEMDFWVNVLFGEARARTRPLPPSLQARASVQRAIRVERTKSGFWGVATAAAVEGGNELPMTELNQTEDDPALAAEIILKNVLWLGESTEDES